MKPKKNVPLLGHPLHMTHDCALLILVSRMSFSCGLKNSQSLSMLLKGTEFGSVAQRATASRTLCSTALPTARGAGRPFPAAQPPRPACRWHAVCSSHVITRSAPLTGQALFCHRDFACASPTTGLISTVSRTPFWHIAGIQ